MAVKLAFSTVACPDWTLAEVLEQAKQMGYEGVELRTLGTGSSALASDPALAQPQKVRRLLDDSGVAPVCLSTSVALHHRDSADAQRADQQALAYLDLASQIGCPQLRVFGYKVRPGQNRQAVIQQIAQRAKPLVDRAAEQGVRLLFENAGSFNRAKEWWWLFNLIDHPMIGMCWNVANAAAAGEPPSVSVPCLNTRIHLAKVKDTHIGEGSGFVGLGSGTVGVQEFVKRLLGVGFDGFITFEWDRLWLPSLAPAQEVLPEAHKRLAGWLEDIGKAAKGFTDAEPMNKALKKLLEAASKRADQPASV